MTPGAARELRDRYLDEVSAGRCVVESVPAKYDVTRAVASPVTGDCQRIEPMKLLAA